MPSKTNKTKAKPPAGNPGLTPETTSKEQNPDHNMNPNESSVAAGELPRHETQTDESDSALKAFDELYDDTPDDWTAKDPPPPQSEEITMGDGIEEEDVFLLPESQNFVPGTAEDFTEKMKFNGLRWRQELRKRVRKDPTLKEFLQWVNSRPSPMDESTRSLGQMLHDIKNLRGEADQIIDMGDGYVQMPSATFERHV
jgi:hypothetical protein